MLEASTTALLTKITAAQVVLSYHRVRGLSVLEATFTVTNKY